MLDSASVKRRVAAGYDGMADVYLDKLRGKRRPEIIDYIDRAIDGLPDGARVLDLGCGAGEPHTAYLSSRLDAVGVDISRRQLTLARGFAPSATFLLADMASLPFGNTTFDAITMLYSIIHVPRDEHEALFARLYDLLAPGRRLFAVMGGSDWVGKESDWLGSGVDMYWSHFDADTNVRLVKTVGLRLIDSAQVPDPIGGAHLVVLAERPA